VAEYGTLDVSVARAARDWRVVGASVRGPAHEQSGLPCQDRMFYRCKDAMLVAVISDGAGSATHAEIGAEICASVVGEQLFKALQGATAPDISNVTGIRLLLEQAVISARHSLPIAERLANSDDPRFSDYHATLLGAVAQPAGGFFFHIGDGAAVAYESFPDGSQVISGPENGEYANETFFFTEADWRVHLRITPFPTAELVILTTDGAASLAFVERFENAKATLMVPLTSYLDGADVETATGALARLLNRDDARRANEDDKTLVWARLIGS
jgi:hypothetical protein